MTIDDGECVHPLIGVARKFRAAAKAVGIAFLFAASAVAAQAGSEVILIANYLADPTDWCPATEGVPLVVTMDGPDIVEGPKAWPRTVKVNRGGLGQQVVSSDFTDSFRHPEDFDGPAANVIGRFSAEFRTCHSAWRKPRPTGSWRVTRKDGGELGSGVYENYLFGGLHPPFFRPVGGASNSQFVKFDDQTFFAIGPIETKVSQTFLAEPEKE